MAQQIIGLGLAPNDGSGDKVRIGAIKINDNFTELYDKVQTLESGAFTPTSVCRSKLLETCSGIEDEVIAFSSQFVTVYALQIIDYEGIGIEATAQDEDGFTITSLSAGNFGYIALIEV